jgi:hypothetical protein
MPRTFKQWTPATAELELLHECWLARLPPARIAARLGISEPKLNRCSQTVSNQNGSLGERCARSEPCRSAIPPSLIIGLLNEHPRRRTTTRSMGADRDTGGLHPATPRNYSKDGTDDSNRTFHLERPLNFHVPLPAPVIGRAAPRSSAFWLTRR